MKNLKEYAKENNLQYETAYKQAINGKIPFARKDVQGKIFIYTEEEILNPDNNVYPLSYIPYSGNTVTGDNNSNNNNYIENQYTIDENLFKQICDMLIKTNTEIFTKFISKIIDNTIKSTITTLLPLIQPKYQQTVKDVKMGQNNANNIVEENDEWLPKPTSKAAQKLKAVNQTNSVDNQIKSIDKPVTEKSSINKPSIDEIACKGNQIISEIKWGDKQLDSPKKKESQQEKQVEEKVFNTTPLVYVKDNEIAECFETYAKENNISFDDVFICEDKKFSIKPDVFIKETINSGSCVLYVSKDLLNNDHIENLKKYFGNKLVIKTITLDKDKISVL